MKNQLLTEHNFSTYNYSLVGINAAPFFILSIKEGAKHFFPEQDSLQKIAQQTAEALFQIIPLYRREFLKRMKKYHSPELGISDTGYPSEKIIERNGKRLLLEAEEFRPDYPEGFTEEALQTVEVIFQLLQEYQRLSDSKTPKGLVVVMKKAQKALIDLSSEISLAAFGEKFSCQPLKAGITLEEFTALVLHLALKKDYPRENADKLNNKKRKKL